MRRSLGWLVSFVLVLVCTVAAVAVFSAMSRVSPAHEQEVQAFSVGTGEHQAMSAPSTSDSGISPIASSAGFIGLMALLVLGLMIYARSKRPAKKVKARPENRIEGRAYRSRRQM